MRKVPRVYDANDRKVTVYKNWETVKEKIDPHVNITEKDITDC